MLCAQERAHATEKDGGVYINKKTATTKAELLRLQDGEELPTYQVRGPAAMLRGFKMLPDVHKYENPELSLSPVLPSEVRGDGQCHNARNIVTRAVFFRIIIIIIIIMMMMMMMRRRRRRRRGGG